MAPHSDMQAGSRPIGAGTAAGPARRGSSVSIDLHRRVPAVLRTAVLVLPALVLGLHRIDSADIWFHLATGRWIVESHRVPATDPFAGGTAAAHWINPEWLADLGFDLLHGLGGPAALVVLAAALGALALALPLLLALAAGDRRRWPYEWVLLLATLIAYERFFARPEILSIFLAALCAGVLARGGPRGWRSLAALVLAQMVWANVHAAFVLGPLFALLALLGDALDWQRGRDPGRPRWISLTLPAFLVLASCATPYGPRLLVHALGAWHALGGQAFRSGIVEWQPTFAGPVAGDLALMAFVASLVWLVASLAIGRRTLAAFQLLLVAFMTALALTARRHLALYAVTALPTSAVWLAAWLDRPAASFFNDATRSRLRRTAGAALAALLAAASLVAPTLAIVVVTDVARGQFYRRFGPPRLLGFGFSATDHPAGAGDFIASHGLRGPLFNNIAAGSYLVWRLRGDPPPFVDGRLLDPERFRFYRHLLESPADFDTFATSHGLETAVFALQPVPPVQLFRHLYASPSWRLVYLDGEGAVFVRAETAARRPDLASVRLEAPLPDAAPADARGAPERWWHVCDPGEAFVRGQVLQRLGFPRAARHDLTRALVLCPERWEIGLALSSALIALGESSEALPLVERALRNAPACAEAWVNLGLVHAAVAEYEEARQCWKNALAVRPPDMRAARLLRDLDSLPAGARPDSARGTSAAPSAPPTLQDSASPAGRAGEEPR